MQQSHQLPNPLMQKLHSGGVALGMVVKQARTVDIALIAHTCGYDAITIDLEHSSMSEDTAAQISIAALNIGVTPLVRVPSHDAYYAGRILDAGAAGIVFPHVETADQAQALVQSCCFPPRGGRSVADQWPHLAYRSFPAHQARPLLQQQTTIVIMLESPKAIENANEIAAVAGVDILHIGTSDLCEAFGIPGDFSHRWVSQAYKEVIDACRIHGKYVGAGGLGRAPETTEVVMQMGARFITAGNDRSFLMQAAGSMSARLHQVALESH